MSETESETLVHRMHFAAGEACDFEWWDPNVAYIVRPDKRPPVRPQRDREPWRDVGVLALLNDRRDGPDQGERRIRPAIVSQFARLSQEAPEVTGRELRLRLYGMRTDLKMKVFEWHRQLLTLPVPLVLHEALHRHLVAAVAVAEEIHDVLRQALVRAMTVARHEPTSKGEALVRLARASYWNALESRFRQLAERLGGLKPETVAEEMDAAVTWWRHTVVRQSMSAYDGATRALRPDAAHLIAVEQGRARLLRALRRLAAPPGTAPEPRVPRRARSAGA